MQPSGPVVPILKQIDACCDAERQAPLTIAYSDAQTLRSYIRMLEREKLQSNRVMTLLRATQRALLDAIVVFGIGATTRYFQKNLEAIEAATSYYREDV